MQRRRRQPGFVLMAALVVLALAGVLLSAVVRRSSALALRANAAQRGLQRRWGVISIQRTFLGRTEDILTEAEAETDGPVAHLRKRLVLGDTEFELLFGDEQARANVNTIYRRFGRRGLMAALEDLLARDVPGLKCLLNPAPAAVASKGKPRQPFECLGQFVADCDGAVLEKMLAADEPALRAVTCWGDGRLNLRRCSPGALAEVARGILDGFQQQKLLALREEIPGIGLAEATRRLQLTDAQLEQASAVLTDESRCYSLWLVVRTPRRRWYRLGIIETLGTEERGKVVQTTFAW